MTERRLPGDDFLIGRGTFVDVEPCPGCFPSNPAARERARCKRHARHHDVTGKTPTGGDVPLRVPCGGDDCQVCAAIAEAGCGDCTPEGLQPCRAGCRERIDAPMDDEPCDCGNCDINGCASVVRTSAEPSQSPENAEQVNGWCRTCGNSRTVWAEGGMRKIPCPSCTRQSAECDMPCDDDCPELCHGVHDVPAKRTHEREDCPAVRQSADLKDPR